MPRRKLPRTPTKITAKATARLEAVAKATYQRKKTITEVIPPDVTRAKAGKWLDLISPITEWAGLKGDALNYQRQQLRIQQEAALEKLAHGVRAKMSGQRVVKPLPSKVLVPALEAASLEEPDSPLIEWWASLLVSGATGGSARPYLADLMSKVGVPEAMLLDELWVSFCKSPGALMLPREYRHFIVSEAIRQIELIVRRDTKLVGDAWRTETLDAVRNFARNFVVSENSGIGVQITLPQGIVRRALASEIFDRGGASLDVCRALNLLGFQSVTHEFNAVGLQHSYEVGVLNFTELGIEFMKACRPDALPKSWDEDPEIMSRLNADPDFHRWIGGLDKD